MVSAAEQLECVCAFMSYVWYVCFGEEERDRNGGEQMKRKKGKTHLFKEGLHL